MILEDADFESCGWLANPGPFKETVLSSRVRLARNVDGFPFSHWASTGELARLVSTCSTAIRQTSMAADCEEIHLEDKSEVDLQFLQERHQISQEMANGLNQRSVFVCKSQMQAVMVAEEDHLRLQAILPGLNLEETWKQCGRLDSEISSQLSYAYSERLGYLTACPTNVGTGLRCSIMVHLPALVMTRQIQKMVNAVAQMGMTVRGPEGEGSEIKGNLFQISNQVTLGITEADLIERLNRLAGEVVESEKKATRQLVEEAEEDLADRAMRAYGILSNARKLTSKETLELLSPYRLGITSGVVKNGSLETINELMLCTRPAHLQKKAGKPLDVRERDIWRAQFVREKLRAPS